MPGMFGNAMLDVGPAEAGAHLGFEPADGDYSYMGSRDDGGDLGPGGMGRRTLIVWAASALWLFMVWRAVEGF